MKDYVCVIVHAIQKRVQKILNSVYLEIRVSVNVKDLSRVQNMMPFSLGHELAHLKPKVLTGRNESINSFVCPEAYLEPSPASTTEFFCINSLQLLVVNYFRKKAPTQMFDQVLNTLLIPMYLMAPVFSTKMRTLKNLIKKFSSLCQWFTANKLSIHFGKDKTKPILFSKRFKGN